MGWTIYTMNKIENKRVKYIFYLLNEQILIFSFYKLNICFDFLILINLELNDCFLSLLSYTHAILINRLSLTDGK